MKKSGGKVLAADRIMPCDPIIQEMGRMRRWEQEGPESFEDAGAQVWCRGKITPYKIIYTCVRNL